MGIAELLAKLQLTKGSGVNIDPAGNLLLPSHKTGGAMPARGISAITGRPEPTAGEYMEGVKGALGMTKDAATGAASIAPGTGEALSLKDFMRDFNDAMMTARTGDDPMGTLEKSGWAGLSLAGAIPGIGMAKRASQKVLGKVDDVFDAAAMRIANATGKGCGRGAVGAKAITPKHVLSTAAPGERILDFGAGSDAFHTKRLREYGFDATAYEFGDNVVPGLHDPDALTRQYDTVFASNVLNVQSDPEMLATTLMQIKNSVAEGGRAVFNYPKTPRKGNMSPQEVEQMIAEIFDADPRRVGGTAGAPMWEVRPGMGGLGVEQGNLVKNNLPPAQGAKLFGMAPVGAAYGFEQDPETGELTFDPELAVKGMVLTSAGALAAPKLFGLMKRGKQGRYMRGGRARETYNPRASFTRAGAHLNSKVDISGGGGIETAWDQVGSVEEAAEWGEEMTWLDPVVLDTRKDLRWTQDKKLGTYGNDKMKFPNMSYPKGRNTWDIQGCGRAKWAKQNGLDATQACYGGGCYAERIKKGKQGQYGGVTGGVNKKSVGGAEREELLKYWQENGIEMLRKKYGNTYEFKIMDKLDAKNRREIAEKLEKGLPLPPQYFKQPDGSYGKITMGYFETADNRRIPFSDVEEIEPMEAVVTTNLQPANGQDIRLGVDTDGGAWLSDPRVMDAIVDANPGTVTVYSSAYHKPPPPHPLSDRTIINVTVSGWHPLPETYARLRWAKEARKNGWNVILREVTADPSKFIEHGRYNRVHDIIMDSDFFVMEQPLHLGKTHGDSWAGLPGCCKGGKVKVQTCDACETAEGTGLGFQEHWNIYEEPDVPGETLFPAVPDFPMRIKGGQTRTRKW
jgi:hypothetical protein